MRRRIESGCFLKMTLRPPIQAQRKKEQTVLEHEQKWIRKRQVLQQKFWTVAFSAALLIGLLLLNFVAYRVYQTSVTFVSSGGELTVVPFGSIAFVLIGLLLLGISCFTSLQLRQYKTGKLFAAYVLLLGLSVSLASCNFLSDPLIPLIRAALNFGSSILLFRIIGYVTLQKSKKLYGALQAVMILAAVLGMASKIVSLFPLEQGWLYAFVDQAENGSVILSASLCILLMAASYRKSNEYSKKQMKILLLGLGLGAFLFPAISILPDLMIVQNIYSDEAVYIEVTMDLGYTVARSVPLLLFTGISAAIIFLLLRRAFSVDDPRLKIWPFVFYPLYTGAICFLLFLYGNAPMWIIAVVALLLVLPPLYQFWKMFSSPAEVAEQTYERRLLGEVEKEKQELSIYLHDDVLQSLIAFYRKIRSDRSGQYREMETALSELIAGVRRVSHNLYPTNVEDLGLEQSLQMCISELQNDYPSIAFDYRYQLCDGILPKALSLTIYRVARELMTNGAKHSEGTEISLRLEEDDAGYYIHVEDNGKGIAFPHHQAMLGAAHMGLYTVKRQVAALGGRINVESGPSAGTKYDIYLPKEEA